MTNPPMAFSFPKAILFFFQGKEVIDLVQYSLFRNQKKKERNERRRRRNKRETEREIKEEKRIFGTIFFMVLPLSKFCSPTLFFYAHLK